MSLLIVFFLFFFSSSYCFCAPTTSKTVPPERITAIFPAEVFHLRIPTTIIQRDIIQKAIAENPDNEEKQWAVINAQEPQLAARAQSLLDFLKDIENRLSPPGKLLFNKLIDGIPLYHWGEEKDIRMYVFETLRLWYSMDIPSKQNFIAVLPKNAAALSHPDLVPFALAAVSPPL